MTEIAMAVLTLTVLLIALAALVDAARAALVPSGPVTITVNGRETIRARAGGKLLAALTGNGVLIPSACAGAGTCGLCRVTVTDGAGAPLPTEAARLPAADLRAGVRLACQMPLRADMAIEVPDEMVGAEPIAARIASVRPLTPLIREVVIQLPEDLRPPIVAGAFVQVTAPPYALRLADLAVPAEHADVWAELGGLTVESAEPVTRAYSISNRPEDSDAGRMVLNIRLALPPPSVADAPPGIVSSWLFSVQPGDPVEISGPFGSFRAQPTAAEMILIGGGVGMAPLRAIILDQLERAGSTRRIGFWYGARSRRELFYEQELDRLAAAHANFDWTVALSDPLPQDEWTGPTGFIHRIVWEKYLRDHPAPEACEYYLCGPPMMIRAVLAMLEDAGVDRAQIYLDDFGV